jgi:hypothetical protein
MYGSQTGDLEGIIFHTGFLEGTSPIGLLNFIA